MEEIIQKCSFDKWYPILRDDTIRSKIIELPDDFKEFLLFHEFIIEDGKFKDLEKRVNDAIDELGGVAFPKLNFTAPTDSNWIGFGKSIEVRSFKDLVYVFKASTRMLIDITCPFNVQNVEIKPIIVLKKWFNYKVNREFRIFMRDSEHFFVSSRNISVPYYLTQEEVREGAQTMVNLISQKIHPYRIIIDFYISPKMRPHVIDIAPWTDVTSPLLYSWSELELLAQTEVRLTTDLNVQPPEDAAVPSDMADGRKLEEIMASLKEFKDEFNDNVHDKFPDDLKIGDGE